MIDWFIVGVFSTSYILLLALDATLLLSFNDGNYLFLLVNSMGAFLLSSGTKGVHVCQFWCYFNHCAVLLPELTDMFLFLTVETEGKRFSLPNSRIMIHQPIGGSEGDLEDMQIQVSLQFLDVFCSSLTLCSLHLGIIPFLVMVFCLS